MYQISSWAPMPAVGTGPAAAIDPLSLKLKKKTADDRREGRVFLSPAGARVWGSSEPQFWAVGPCRANGTGLIIYRRQCMKWFSHRFSLAPGAALLAASASPGRGANQYRLVDASTPGTATQNGGGGGTNPSWSTPYKQLQDAIDRAGSNHVIGVAGGDILPRRRHHNSSGIESLLACGYS